MINQQNKKKIQLLEAAKRLFWKFGIKKVTVEEICSEAQVSKMTFYKMFKNKDEIAESLLNETLSSLHTQFYNIMSQNILFSEKIKLIVLLEQSSSQEMSEEFIKDIYNNEFTELQKILKLDRERYQTEFILGFTQAQKNGEIRNDIKPEFILYLWEDINSKVMDKNLSKMYHSKHELLMALTNYFFYGILNSSK